MTNEFPSKEKAKDIVAQMNKMLRQMPIDDAVMNAEYIKLLDEVKAGGRWGVLVKDLKMVEKKPWAQLRLVPTNDPEYRELFGE